MNVPDGSVPAASHVGLWDGRGGTVADLVNRVPFEKRQGSAGGAYR